jgi:hypothetical protein
MPQIFRREHQRHAVMNPRADRVRLGRQDREAFDARRFRRRRVLRLPPFPKSRESKRPSVSARDKIGLFLLRAELLPFIESIRHDKARARLEGGAVRGQAGGGFRARVNSSATYLIDIM